LKIRRILGPAQVLRLALVLAVGLAVGLVQAQPPGLHFLWLPVHLVEELLLAQLQKQVYRLFFLPWSYGASLFLSVMSNCDANDYISS
jgi:hypothetical protein